MNAPCCSYVVACNVISPFLRLSHSPTTVERAPQRPDTPINNEYMNMKISMRIRPRTSTVTGVLNAAIILTRTPHIGTHRSSLIGSRDRDFTHADVRGL